MARERDFKMSPTKFSFRQFTSGFFEPLIKHLFLTVSASLIIGIVLYTGIDVGLAEVVRQNSYPIHTLSAELLTESGPDFAEASRDHAEMLRLYTKHLEQRQLAPVLRILYPTYNPSKALKTALSSLENAVQEKEAEEAIRQAGLATREFYIRSERFPRSPIKWFEYEVVSDELLKDLDNAFEEFHEQVNNLENAQGLKAAEDECRAACRKSRTTFLLLSLARLGYDNKEKKIERFLSDLKTARKKALEFAEKKDYKSKWKLFSDRAKNMGLRAEAVKAMLDNDMDRFSELLKKAIEKALKKDSATE